ncbi:hypothetical protein T07_737 [Trichinella nelsoni]|uniref:Uncharacterized protein n=1 Tax=Trichinella nelsoni TaxID=6336 RepID=A0A0V0SBE3_9BILA|nr:hypothetical protein T07_737 [Trichinella nelsoni]
MICGFVVRNGAKAALCLLLTNNLCCEACSRQLIFQSIFSRSSSTSSSGGGGGGAGGGSWMTTTNDPRFRGHCSLLALYAVFSLELIDRLFQLRFMGLLVHSVFMGATVACRAIPQLQSPAWASLLNKNNPNLLQIN